MSEKGANEVVSTPLLKTCVFLSILERGAASLISCFHYPYPEMSTKETQLQRPRSISYCRLNMLRLFWISGPTHSEDSHGTPPAGQCLDQGSVPLEREIFLIQGQNSVRQYRATVMYHQNKSGHVPHRKTFIRFQNKWEV